jgi:hypothetical protein
MKTSRVTFGDVRWLDEHALVAAALSQDPEAFAELIRRYDPVVRYKIWRVLGGPQLVQPEQLDGVIADFWCALVDVELEPLATWQEERGELLGAALGSLATQFASDRLRHMLREMALAKTQPIAVAVTVVRDASKDAPQHASTSAPTSAPDHAA